MDEFQDEELMSLFCSGQTSAFRVLFDKYRDRVLRYICAVYEWDGARAEEYTQDVFLKVIEHRERYNTTMCFSTWLFTITRNHCKNQIRRKASRPKMQGGGALNLFDAEDPARSATETMQVDELGKIIRRAVGQLPENLRDVFVLREIEELPHGEIADILDIQEGNVRTMLHRAKKQLQDIITPYLKDES